MCSRYWIAADDDGELAKIIAALNRKGAPENVKTSGEIFPSDTVPVVANNRQLKAQPFAMRWGYSFPDGHPIINARSETAQTKPLFQDGMRRRRCLIPAKCYFEWERRDKERIKYAIRPAHGRILYFAGIYHWEQHSKATFPTFAILTQQAAPEIAFIHERMPTRLAEPAKRCARHLASRAARYGIPARMRNPCSLLCASPSRTGVSFSLPLIFYFLLIFERSSIQITYIFNISSI